MDDETYGRLMADQKDADELAAVEREQHCQCAFTAGMPYLLELGDQGLLLKHPGCGKDVLRDWTECLYTVEDIPVSAWWTNEPGDGYEIDSEFYVDLKPRKPVLSPPDPAELPAWLRALPVGTVLLDHFDVVFQAQALVAHTIFIPAWAGGGIFHTNRDGDMRDLCKHAPFRVLHTPTTAGA